MTELQSSHNDGVDYANNHLPMRLYLRTLPVHGGINVTGLSATENQELEEWVHSDDSSARKIIIIDEDQHGNANYSVLGSSKLAEVEKMLASLPTTFIRNDLGIGKSSFKKDDDEPASEFNP